jgi:LuxR family maltose regulon positive regulatory protein
MTTPLLTTKLYIPPPRPNLVERPRLVKRLDEGLSLGHRLTLISAPAGFGKTTLLSEWVQAMGEATPPIAVASDPPTRMGWLSLDEGDNDLTRFLTYFIAALNQAEETETTVGEGTLGMLQSPQPPPTEGFLTSLINEIAAIPDRIVLVLDDYHLIESSPVDDALTFTLEHLPETLHLVIATRENPNLPLARLRARGQMTELRVADLRFTPGEAATFLNQVMGLNLSAEEIAALETRTEGWIAGLQLAALSMRGRSDVSGFIRAFAGDNRYIVDYLVEEVLQRQPERVRSFLLQTSILARLSGPLCDAVLERPSSSGGTAVTGQEDGREMLEALERGNLFVVPLDDKRQWYRYHHLFADVLHAHLREEQPDQVPVLHRRASEWYEQNGPPSDAIRHALAAKDFGHAADLIELAWPAMDGSFQSNTWLGWAMSLPPDLVRARPVLSVAYAWAVLNAGELEAAETRLRDAEQWLDSLAGTSARETTQAYGTVVADEEQFRALPASIATARAYIAQSRGDVPGTITYARRALNLLPEEDYVRRGPAASLLGLAYWGRGELEAAHQTLADAMAKFRMAGSIAFALSGTYGLADIRVAQGRLRAAISTYEQALQYVMELGDPDIRGTADLYLGLSKLYYEQGDPEAAQENLLRSEELGEQAALDISREIVIP